MHAIQPQRPSRHPSEPRRIASKPRPRRLPRPRHRAVVTEAATKLTANVVLSIAFTSGIVTLLPYNLTQQVKLQEIRDEVKVAQKRVGGLEKKLNLLFGTDRSPGLPDGTSSPATRPDHKRVVITPSDAPVED